MGIALQSLRMTTTSIYTTGIIHEIGDEILHDLVLCHYVSLKIEHLTDDLLIVPRESLQVIVHASLHRLHSVDLALQALKVPTTAVEARAITHRTRLTRLPGLDLWHTFCGGRLSFDVVEGIAVMDIEFGMLEFPCTFAVRIAF